jgi:hypothetical protein
MIAVVSACLAHMVVTSPAWNMKFSYLVPMDPEEGYTTRPTNWGWLIENVRAFLLVAFAYFVIAHLHFEGVPEGRSTQRAYLIVFSLIWATVFVGIVYYHFWFAPDALADAWEGHSLDQFPGLREEKGYWGEVSRDPNWPEKLGDRWSAEYRRMFVWPYVAFLPYSLAIYLGVMLPVLHISFRGSRNDYVALSVLFDGLSARVRETNTLSRLYHLIDEFDVAFLRIRAALSRYTWLVAFIGIAAIFEVAIGHYTLAPAAAALGIFGTVLLAGGLLFLVPNVMHWGELVSAFRLAVAEAKRLPSAEDEIDPDAMQKHDEHIEDLERRLLSKESMGIATKFVLGLLGVFAGVARALSLLR